MRHFIPMAYSVDGLVGKEARTAEKRLASLLTSKWDRPYSETWIIRETCGVCITYREIYLITKQYVTVALLLRRVPLWSKRMD